VIGIGTAAGWLAIRGLFWRSFWMMIWVGVIIAEPTAMGIYFLALSGLLLFGGIAVTIADALSKRRLNVKRRPYWRARIPAPTSELSSFEHRGIGARGPLGPVRRTIGMGLSDAANSS
jgi:hypothetical protein